MQTATFTYNGARGHVRAATIRDQLAIDILSNRLGRGASHLDRWGHQEFARFVQLTDTLEGDIGFALPAPDASANELQAGYEAWLALPGDLLNEWRNALTEAAAPPNADPNAAGPAADDGASARK